MVKRVLALLMLGLVADQAFSMRRAGGGACSAASGFSFNQGSDEDKLTELTKFRQQLYKVNQPHTHDRLIPHARVAAIGLAEKWFGKSSFSFEKAKSHLLGVAKGLDNGRIKKPAGFAEVEVGARGHQTYHALLQSRFQHWLLSDEIKRFLPICYHVAEQTDNGLAGLVVACGLEKGQHSTDSAVYNDLFSYLVDALQANQQQHSRALDDKGMQQALAASLKGAVGAASFAEQDEDAALAMALNQSVVEHEDLELQRTLPNSRSSQAFARGSNRWAMGGTEAKKAQEALDREAALGLQMTDDEKLARQLQQGFDLGQSNSSPFQSATSRQESRGYRERDPLFEHRVKEQMKKNRLLKK